MIWIKVESSQIAEVGYDSDAQTLGIRFPAGPRSAASEYHYSDVPARVHRAMIEAKSVGSYFLKEIKPNADKYPYVKVGEVAAQGEIVDSPGSSLAKIDVISASDLFTPGFMDSILETIRTEVLDQASKLDISTEANRKAIASIAYKVAKSKTFVDQQRKTLVASEKKRLATIDAEGARIWMILEGIQKEVRQPLTDWENAEKERVEGHQTGVADIYAMKPHMYPTITALEEAITMLDGVDPSEFQEFQAPANVAKQQTLDILRDELEKRKKALADSADLERLRKESEARAQQDAIENAANAAREQADRERIAAEKRAEESDRLRVEAELNAARRAEEAVEAERQRIAAQEKEATEAAEARARNDKHRAKVNKEAIEAMCAFDVPSATAKRIVDAIAAGSITHIAITY